MKYVKIQKKSSKPISRILFPVCLHIPVFHHLSGRSTPRYRASSPQAPVYVIFQHVRRTAGDVTITAGRLLPCLLTLACEQAVIFFSASMPSRTSSLSEVRCSLLSGLSSPVMHTNMHEKSDGTVYCFLFTIK